MDTGWCKVPAGLILAFEVIPSRRLGANLAGGQFGLLLCFPRIYSRYAVLHFRLVTVLHTDHHFNDTDTRTGTVHPQHAFKPFLILFIWICRRRLHQYGIRQDGIQLQYG